jgi:hypothetical protein
MTLTPRAGLVALTLLMIAAGVQAQGPAIYRPPLTVPESLEPFLKYLEPGSDGFTAEREARALSARLGEFSQRLRQGRTADVATWLLAPDFRQQSQVLIDESRPRPGPSSAFHKNDLDAGSYVVVVKAAGRKPGVSAVVTVAENQIARDVVVALHAQ